MNPGRANATSSRTGASEGAGLCSAGWLERTVTGRV